MKTKLYMSIKIIVSVCLSILILCCNENINSNEISNFPRDYMWDSDTIEYISSIQTLMRSVWQTSETNIYVVGYNARGKGYMYNYNGINWNLIDLSAGTLSLSDIYGFTESNIWVCGDASYLMNSRVYDSSLVFHFDGAKWKEVLRGGGYALKTIAGDKDDLWFGGSRGTLFHWDGKIFSKNVLPYNPLPEDSLTNDISSIVADNLGNLYALMYVHRYNSNAPNIHILYKKNRDSPWMKIDSTNSEGPYRLWINKDNSLYGVFENTIQRWNGSGWSIFFKDSVSNPFFISGVSENDIVVLGEKKNDSESTLHHYNGKNWYKYENINLKGLSPRRVLFQNNNIVVITNTYESYPQKTIILRGK
jgi:hypothetical protein